MSSLNSAQGDLPELVFIRLREQCNARCQMCSFWHSPDGEGLARKQLVNIIRELTEFGVGEITFTGGEPFYYPGLDSLLDQLGSLSSPPGISIITNGSRCDDLARRALAYRKLVRIHVSLDDLTNKGMLAIRGREGWYRGILDFVRMVRDLAPNTKVIANAIINRHNWDRLAAYLNHDFDGVNFLLLKTGRDLEMQLEEQESSRIPARLSSIFLSNAESTRRLYVPFATDPSYALAFPEYIWGGASWGVPCVLTSRLVYIDHNGEVFPCNCLAHDGRGSSLGNILRESFATIWNGKGRKFREHCTRDDWRTCDGCDPANRLYNLVAGSAMRSKTEAGPHAAQLDPPA